MRTTGVIGLLLAACGSPSTTSNAPDASSSTEVDAATQVPDAPAASHITRCSATPPAGAVEAPAFPTYAGTCPTFAAAPAVTSFQSSGDTREFMVVAPATIAPGEKLPVVFIWHWLGGDAQDVYEQFLLQEVVDFHRFIAVVPEDKGDILFRWPFGVSQSDARLAEEVQFFDDMLACVAATYTADKNCVSTMGVSAGALMTAQLASRRAHRLASFASISGGVGERARDWSPASRPLPGLVMWGGPTDMYPEDIPLEHFDTASIALEDGLVAGGHMFMECIHNCGHALPPFDPPASGEPAFGMIWDFLLDHPFWLPGGTSIYQTAMPATVPSWCGLGKGGATPRPESAVCPE